MFSVKGKKVYITGSSGGIGSALVVGFREAGADVITFDIKVDKTNPNLGGIDVLINCAGLNNPEYQQDMMETNFWMAYRLCYTATKVMKNNGGGSIINITSLGAELGFPDNPIYQASKAALRQLTKTIAVDHGKYGIRANNVCPGYIRTEMTFQSFGNPDEKAARDKRMILPRWGKPEDIVGACVFLASDASSYITGSDIYVDGGWTAKGL